MQVNYRLLFKWGIAIVVVFILAILYKTYSPAGSIYFPKCPFKLITGLECPGCGSQRAMHYLLNFEVWNAIKENAVLVVSIPYIITGFVFDSIGNLSDRALKWRKTLFGRTAIFIVLSIIIAFWILRNFLPI